MRKIPCKRLLIDGGDLAGALQNYEWMLLFCPRVSQSNAIFQAIAFHCYAQGSDNMLADVHTARTGATPNYPLTLLLVRLFLLLVWNG